jgi:hypothetical protein
MRLVLAASDLSSTTALRNVPSLVKKALVRRKTYDEITDKAGVRAAYQYKWQGDVLEDIIENVFVVHKREDKAAEMPPDRLGYLGVHYDVTFRDDDERAPAIALDHPACEIQLRTLQQDAWAVYAHELLYKTAQEVPVDVRRSLFRLVALVEIFDREVNNGRDIILGQPGYVAGRMLERLEREFYRLTAREYDGELSRLVLATLLPLYGGEEPEQQLDHFLAEYGAKLDYLYKQYLDDDRAPQMLFQPEALVIFDLLQHIPTSLEEAFTAVAPRELLEDLAIAWGTPLDESV